MKLTQKSKFKGHLHFFKPHHYSHRERHPQNCCGIQLGNSLDLLFVLFLESPKSHIDKPLRRIFRRSTNT